MAQMRLPVDYKKQVHKSVFNLSTVKRTTILPGEIIPIYSRRCMAGDKFIIDINALLKSVPLSSPLYGTFKLQTAVFFDSDTNYYGYLDNNSKHSTQDLLQKVAHRCNFVEFMKDVVSEGDDADFERLYNGSWNNFRGSVLDYMGVPSGLVTKGEYGGFNDPIDIGFILTYLNIFRNYFANKQAKKFPYISDGSFADKSAITWQPDIAVLDNLFLAIRNSQNGIDFNSIGTELPADVVSFMQNYLTACTRNSGGILLSTYLPDLYRNLLDDTFNTSVSKVSTTDNSFTIDSLRFANKLQRLVDRFDISGGRFSDWLRTVWGVQTNKNMDIPEIIGVSQSLIDPSQVTAMAQTGEQGADGSTDLGQFGGNFDNFARQRKHSFVASTPGRVMVTVTLVPMVDYSQGIEPELLEVNFADRYFPEFEQLGYQKVPRLWYNASLDYDLNYSENNGVINWDSARLLNVETSVDQSVGKQVAWLPLMTDVNHCHGEFGNNGYYENWVLKRRYQTRQAFEDSENVGDWIENVKTDIMQYILPTEYQYPFLLKSVSDPNWFLQMAIDVKAVRPKGKRFMPNLE